MLIQPNQLKRIFSLLRETGETAWRDEYIGLVSNHTKSSTKDLSYDEANDVITLLERVKSGNRVPFNPNPIIKETPNKPTDQENKLRRKIFSICHTLGWYVRDENQILVLNKNEKPTLDFNRIDNYCLIHSKYKKKMYEHTYNELTGKGGLVWLFETLKTNTIYKESKPWKKN